MNPGGSVQWFVGETGCGKTTFIKDLIRQCPSKPVLKFSTKYNLGPDTIMDFNEWKEKALKATDTLLIADEMDSCLRPQRGQADREMVQIMANAREYNNMFIGITHCLEYLGNWCLMNADAIRLWKTGDMSMYPFYERFRSKPQLTRYLYLIPNLPKYKSIFIGLK